MTVHGNDHGKDETQERPLWHIERAADDLLAQANALEEAADYARALAERMLWPDPGVTVALTGHGTVTFTGPPLESLTHPSTSPASGASPLSFPDFPGNCPSSSSGRSASEGEADA